MKKVLCKPCAVETAARKDREVKQLPGRSEKITLRQVRPPALWPPL